MGEARVVASDGPGVVLARGLASWGESQGVLGKLNRTTGCSGAGVAALPDRVVKPTLLPECGRY